jgi:putative peptide zinc metalloprotease protein
VTLTEAPAGAVPGDHTAPRTLGGVDAAVPHPGTPHDRDGGGEQGPAAADEQVPYLIPGTELLGAYRDSGYDGERFLVRRADGQVALVSPLVYQVAQEIDGSRPASAVAAAVSARSGRTLTAANLVYLVDAKLSPLGIATRDGLPAPVLRRKELLLGLMLRHVLVPARVVRPLARWLAPLFHPFLVVVTLPALIALDVWLFTTQGTTSALFTVVSRPGFLLTVFALLFAGAVWHELGHAAACRYGGGTPGRIGIGIYLMLPAFYTDVTDAYRLSRRGRLRTDLGGVYFNALFCLVAGAVALFERSAMLTIIIVLTQVTAVQQLLPVVRFDGYFVLTDLIGVPDLFGKAAPGLRRALPGRRTPDARWSGLRPKVRVAVGAWLAIVVPALLATMVYLGMHMSRFVQVSWRAIRADALLTWRSAQHVHFSEASLAALSLIILSVPLIGLTLFVGRSLPRAVFRVIRPGRHSAGRAVKSAAG